MVNTMIRFAFNVHCNDVTNAFKMYRREVIEGCKPFISPHFNLTVEIPLKAIIRGYSWRVVPISWKNKHEMDELNLEAHLLKQLDGLMGENWDE